MKTQTLKSPLILMLILLLGSVLAACGATATPAPTPVPPPTWTPTPAGAGPAQAAPAATQAPVAQQPTATPIPPTPVPPTNTPEPEPTATPVPPAKVIITAPQANLRQGPGTRYPRAGAVKQGDEFIILGKNASGDWWQIQVNQQPVWVFGNLVRAENAGAVLVAENIPTPPPVPTKPPPPPPTATPVPAAPDPCASIGGDGCKWHIRGGPAFSANPYGLKLTFGFVHGGRGDEAQGSYFVWLEKDGVKLPVPDSVRSVTGALRTGANGPYNYEYSIGSGDLPGNTPAGCYTGWVLDGNGERDSKNFSFCVPDGQGEVWILFDQS